MIHLVDLPAGESPLSSSARSKLPSQRQRPGRKRLQRTANRSFLLDKEHEVTVEDFNVFIAPTQTPLTRLMSSQNQKQIWEPFVECTEEQQKELISRMESHIVTDVEKRTNSRRMKSSSAKSFQSIGSRFRLLLKKNASSDFFLNIDREIVTFLRSDGNEKPLIFELEHSNGRMLCHGICEYYSLVSKSMNVNINADEPMMESINESTLDESMKRIVVIMKSGRSTIPGESLSLFLQKHCRNAA